MTENNTNTETKAGKESDELNSVFQVDHRPERSKVVTGDVTYCPNCGGEVPPENTQFREDLVLNRYRTEFECPSCDYHGEVFRHDAT